MNSNAKSIIGALCLIPSALCAQTVNNASPGLKFSSVYVQAGYGTVQLPYPELSNFQKLAPGSDLLDQEYLQAGFPYSSSRARMRTFLAGITITSSGKKSIRDRLKYNVGMAYCGGILSVGHAYHNRRKVFDTLKAGNSGTTYYLDSVSYQNLMASQQGDELRLDFSFTISTASTKRLSFYAGLGLSAGFSYLHNTIIRENGREQIELRQGPMDWSGYISYYSGSAQSDYFKNHNYFVWSAFIPMGMNFRLGKKRDPQSPVQLYYEMRPSLHARYFKETGRTMYPGMLHSAGLRIKISE